MKTTIQMRPKAGGGGFQLGRLSDWYQPVVSVIVPPTPATTVAAMAAMAIGRPQGLLPFERLKGVLP
ncbi:hypothetical protein NSE01_07870 [Novosphingobium sediminis]|uniref:Uncharacterized protein n=1 Tax=Novosphingobium sediminis TaxID=707214 RepID=A0A512AGW9_9SPHN|nr:hypothetical protein NSE01_07870 [Novosphingobium sediminis]